MGLFAAGMQPSGGGDPFALRRTAIGLIETLLAHDQRLDLRQALAAAAAGLPIEASEAVRRDCLEFIERRQQALLLAQGHRHDVVRAVMAEQSYNPAMAEQAVVSLEAWMEREDWPDILQNYARCVRITRDLAEVYPVEVELMDESATKGLWQRVQAADGAAATPGSIDEFMQAFLPLIPAIEAFFDEVLVMAEDEAIKRNRLGVLQRVARLAEGRADLSELDGF
jgi:glycyl-tRNA synthetase